MTERTFLVLSEGRWAEASVPGRVPREISIDQVLAMLPRGGDRNPLSATVAPFADRAVHVVRNLVGELRPDGLMLRASDGADHYLGRDDASLLDEIGIGTSLGNLVDGHGAIALSAVAEMERCGWVTTDPPEAISVVADVTPASARPEVVVAPGPISGPGTIPVYAVWHPESGPLLSLGMLTAAARAHRSGALTDTFQIRRPETAASFLADLEQGVGPAVLLCSNYVWSIDQNIATAKAAVAIRPELIVVHGGPSSPKYEADAAEFLRTHGAAATIVARGEGEHQICALLEAFGRSGGAFDAEKLEAVPGVTFIDPRTGEAYRTPEGDRIADLDALPSPYLTGEFDEIPSEAWTTTLSIETNRGCPYGCTYCDWGSSTLSRIRKFDQDRVLREVQWAASRGIEAINVTDANFGIMSRDVSTAAGISAIKRSTGFPQVVIFYPAKNTTKHLTKIMDEFVQARVGTIASLSLQTTDPDTLDAIERSNISNDHYVALAADYRRRGFPLQAELILGLPGQTVESYRNDLQFNLDHEILSRTWKLQVLPNAPMNDPAYRERYAIEVDDTSMVRSTSTMTIDDRSRMLRLHRAEIVFERLVVLRHVLRYLQWDHGLRAMDVLDRMVRAVEAEPLALPYLAWVVEYFDRFPAAPVAWSLVYDDVRRFVTDELGVSTSPALDAVLALNEFLLPAPGRTFPASIDLQHDYPAYFADATAELFISGRATGAVRPLSSYGPCRFTVASDPLGLCTQGMRFTHEGSGDRLDGDFAIGANSALELLSPLTRLLPHVATVGIMVDALRDHRGHEGWADDLDAAAVPGGAGPVPVAIRSS